MVFSLLLQQTVNYCRWLYAPHKLRHSWRIVIFYLMDEETQPLVFIYYYHDDIIKWKHFPRNWPFVRGIHRSPINSAHKGQWRGALMFSLIFTWIKSSINNREAGNLRHHRAHYDAIVMNSMITEDHSRQKYKVSIPYSSNCSQRFLLNHTVSFEPNLNSDIAQSNQVLESIT